MNLFVMNIRPVSALPGLKLPVMESNGWQNYTHWERMRDALPDKSAAWTHMSGGSVLLADGFYERSANIFEPLPHYEAVAAAELNGGHTDEA